MASDDSAASGGLLVVLGIVVALGGIYFYTQYAGHSSGPSVTVNVPDVSVKQ